MCVVAIDSVPASCCENSSPMRLRLPTSRMISSIALQHLLARLGDAAQALAVAGEDVDAELVLELEDRLRDARAAT